MKFRVESAFEIGEEVLKKYPVLKSYNASIDFPYENKKCSRLTIELNNIEDLIKLQCELNEELVIGEDYMSDDSKGKDAFKLITIDDDYC